jgi:hypothetical protein
MSKKKNDEKKEREKGKRKKQKKREEGCMWSEGGKRVRRETREEQREQRRSACASGTSGYSLAQTTDKSADGASGKLRARGKTKNQKQGGGRVFFLASTLPPQTRPHRPQGPSFFVAFRVSVSAFLELENHQ